MTLHDLTPAPVIPSREQLPFRKLERAYLNVGRCELALAAAERELADALRELAETTDIHLTPASVRA